MSCLYYNTHNYLMFKIFGPLKARFNKLATNVYYSSFGAAVTKSMFPVLLKHGMDQASPSSIQHAFEATGLHPVNRAAINQSQLIKPMFGQARDGNGKL